MIGVTENLRIISDLLAHSAIAAGRGAGDVRLLAVSKQQPPEAVLEAAAAGQRAFGESYVGEALDKLAAIDRGDLEWHFIGRLQSNKTADVARRFDWVHSIDRLKIARRLSEQRPADSSPLNLCLQVNVDAEPGKAGVAVGDVARLADGVAALPGLRLRGLMCLPAIRTDPAAQRVPFAALRRLQDQLIASGHSLDTLSMGMSGDYNAAIAEGATIVRIGTALFGPRPR